MSTENRKGTKETFDNNSVLFTINCLSLFMNAHLTIFIIFMNFKYSYNNYKFLITFIQ